MPDGEKIRKGAEEFLDVSFNSDVCLLFAPSQVCELEASPSLG